MDLTYETLLLSAKREFPSFEATHVSILSPAMSTGSMSHLHSICWVFRYPQNLAPRTGFRWGRRRSSAPVPAAAPPWAPYERVWLAYPRAFQAHGSANRVPGRQLL